MSSPDAGLNRLRANESLLLLDEALMQEEDGITRAVQPGKKNSLCDGA